MSKQFIIYFIVLVVLVSLLILFVVQLAHAQQPSVIWDEASKSWISGPATAPAPALTNPTAQTQLPQPQQQPTYIQTVPAAPSTNSGIDSGTLTAVVTSLVAAIGGIFIKNRKDMEKKDEETRKQTIDEIKAAILPTIKQIAPVAEITSKQSVQINQLAEELYKMMAEKSNEIHDKPDIQQQKLIEDAVRSKMVAEQTKRAAGSVVWDDVKKEWVSK